MNAIRILMDEHRRIERVIAALEEEAGALAQGTPPAPGRLADFVRFIRDYADRAHHGKEEDILFVAMEEAGFPANAGPLGVMRAEHEQGRAFARVLAEVGALPEPGPGDLRRAAAAALGYAALLKAHIQKEDHVLYPMAEARLSPALAERVETECARFERAETESGRAAERDELFRSLTGG